MPSVPWPTVRTENEFQVLIDFLDSSFDFEKKLEFNIPSQSIGFLLPSKSLVFAYLHLCLLFQEPPH